MDPFIAQIVMFGGNFAPRGWAFCDGQLLPIAQYQALFSLLGTTYGGDGRTTFALPELRGRFAMHAGNGPGLPDRRLGQRGGRYSVTLNQTNMPSHTHVAQSQAASVANSVYIPVHDDTGVESEPADHYMAEPSQGSLYSSTADSGEHMGTAGTKIEIPTGAIPIQVGNSGGNINFDIMNPYMVVNYIIALQGTYPSRS